VRMSESRGGRRLRPKADRWGPRGSAGGNTRSARLRENERLTYGPDAAVTPKLLAEQGSLNGPRGGRFGPRACESSHLFFYFVF
jgi:hypothetical protein